MLKIKRLYLFMLQSFVPLFLMTFFICLFIVMMQFLWSHIDDLVGKGLEMSVIGELFFYASLSMVPLALPLAILLASLMTFGNLGERFELMAMKASGISLLKVMRPLIVLMGIIAIAAFFFQNNVLPVTQAKMYTLLWSARQKSPELEIPEGVFYDQIPGYNIFVEKKDRERGTLNNMMIYDVSRGNDLDRVRIILADSGRMNITDDKTHLFLKLYDGEQFENLRDQSTRSVNVPYRRESFTLKEILIPFDNNFNRLDESGMRNQYVGKNMAELQHTIDSVEARVDSIGRLYGQELLKRPYFNISQNPEKENEQLLKTPDEADDSSDELNSPTAYTANQTVQITSVSSRLEKVNPQKVDLDTIYSRFDPSIIKTIAVQALTKARRQKQDFEFRSYTVKDDNKTIRRHEIELIKKFTLSFACIIFFFIGAPLGAIIRKGGLGAPLVISVILFIIYYIIDNTGYKLARDGKWEVWEGMWLSSAVLLPLGIFLTYKAINDSAVLNSDAYLNFFRRLLGITEVRHVEIKELVMEDVNPSEAISKINSLTRQCREYAVENPRRQNFINFYCRGYDRERLNRLSNYLDETIDYLTNSRNKLLLNKLGDYPILRNLWIYNPTPKKWIAWTAIAIFPLSIPLWLFGRKMRGELHSELDKIITIDNEATLLIDENE